MRLAFLVLLAAIPVSAQYPTQASQTAPEVVGLLSPNVYGAKGDALWTNGTNTLSGTDDRAVLRTIFSLAVTNHEHVQIPTTYRADAPGGIITNVAITGNVATITMANKLVAGDRVTPLCLSAVPDLNGAPLDVLTASSTQFTATFYHANVASIAEPGGKTTHGRGAWNPTACPAGAPAVGSSPAFQINTPGLVIDGHGQGSIVGVGAGPMFQFGYDKTAQGSSITSDSSGVVTATISAMPLGVKFNVGTSITLTGTGTALDDTYHTVTSATATTVVFSGAAGGTHASISASQGLLHAPWSNFDADGVGGYQINDLTITNYSRSSEVPCGIDTFFCQYIPGTAAIVDWRGGSGIITNDVFGGLEYGFFGVQSDFTILRNLSASNVYKGAYVGPYSTPFTIEGYNDYGVASSIEIDGNGGQGTNIVGGHLRSGSELSPPINVVNRQYDITAASGGGIPSSGIVLTGVDFEFGQSPTCVHTPLAFIGIDTSSESSTQTQDIAILESTFVNTPKATACNVPYLTQTGGYRGLSQLVKIEQAAYAGSLTGFNHNLSNGIPIVTVDSQDATNAAIPISVDSGGGVSTTYSPKQLLTIANPTFTGVLSGAKVSIQGDDTLNENFANIGTVSSGAGYFLIQNTGNPMSRLLLGMPSGLTGAPALGSGASSAWDSSHGFSVNLNNGGRFSIQCFTSSSPTLNTSAGYLFCGTDHRLHWYGDDYTDNKLAYSSEVAAAVATALAGSISPTSVVASSYIQTPLIYPPASSNLELRAIEAAGIYGTIFTDSTGTKQAEVYSDGHVYTSKYVWDNYTVSNVGTAVASASTIALTAGITHITGTAAIANITPPPGMNSTVGGCLTIIADAASSTTTAGNIFAATTFAAGSVHQACYDGSKFYIQ